MTLTVFCAVILAAGLHATWNALVKHNSDKFFSMTAVVLGHAPIALALLPFAEIPKVESWPYIIMGMVLHVGYQFFLLFSYRLGDFTHVYPIARGVAPLIVAAISALFLGQHFTWQEILAIVTIACGILSLVCVHCGQGLHNPKAAIMAFGTGCFIAAYTMVDGYGARLAGTVLGFYICLAISNAIIIVLIMTVIKPGLVQTVITRGYKTMLFGGTASFTAYALVIWACTQAPIALVAALRETSIIFALMIGVFFLKEKINLIKVVSTFMTFMGAVLLRLPK